METSLLMVVNYIVQEKGISRRIAVQVEFE